MPIVIQRTSDYGTEHPVFARLAVQTAELVKFSTLDKRGEEAVLNLYINTLKPRLLKCYEIRDRLKGKLERSCEEAAVANSRNKSVSVVPAVTGLEGEVESFCYEVKNFLRNLLTVFNVFFGCKFDEAKAWIRPKKGGDSALVDWATAEFGLGDELTKVIASEQEWCSEWIQIRNAFEHPGKDSGTVMIHNIRLFPEGLKLPTWSRAGGPEGASSLTWIPVFTTCSLPPRSS
jgi:hypothetical protein